VVLAAEDEAGRALRDFNRADPLAGGIEDPNLAGGDGFRDSSLVSVLTSVAPLNPVDG
jgi:hypothetical protein